MSKTALRFQTAPRNRRQTTVERSYAADRERSLVVCRRHDRSEGNGPDAFAYTVAPLTEDDDCDDWQSEPGIYSFRPLTDAECVRYGLPLPLLRLTVDPMHSTDGNGRWVGECAGWEVWWKRDGESVMSFDLSKDEDTIDSDRRATKDDAAVAVVEWIEANRFIADDDEWEETDDFAEILKSIPETASD